MGSAVFRSGGLGAGGCSNDGEEENKRMDFASLNLNLSSLENIS